LRQAGCVFLLCFAAHFETRQSTQARCPNGIV